jgi:hypothetical protein
LAGERKIIENSTLNDDISGMEAFPYPMPKKPGTKYSKSLVHNLQQGTTLRSITVIL